MGSIYRKIDFQMSSQQKIAAIVGAITFGLIGLLLAKPAGFSQITLEVQADHIQTPNILKAIWTSKSSWETSFSLPEETPTPVTLEVIATGHRNDQATHSQVWLVGSIWFDGSSIPIDEFQFDNDWEIQTHDWKTYQDQPVLISYKKQPTKLQWKGIANGPLTLIFAAHPRGGEVVVRWNNYEQTIDLYSPGLKFHEVALPTKNEYKPLVWQATLPIRALSEDFGLSIAPDLNGNSPAAIIKKVSVSGFPGKKLEYANKDLIDALYIDNGKAISTPDGVQFIPQQSNTPIRIFLVDPLEPSFRWGNILPILENALLILSLGIIGGIIFGGLARLIPTQLLTNLNITIFSLIISFVTIEIGLDLYLPPRDQYYVRRPGRQIIIKPSPETFTGIQGESNYIINSLGLRSDEMSPEDDYRILALGGSTTECKYLDQYETWTQLLQDNLNSSSDLRVWVGNAGRSGNDTREHILQMEYLLSQYPDIKAVLVLIGVNDLKLRLARGEKYDPNYLNSPGTKLSRLNRAFVMFPDQNPNRHYFADTAIWHLAHTILRSYTQLQQISEIEIDDVRGDVYGDRRARRKNGVIVDELPDLSSALNEYQRNINTLADIAENHNVRLIFLTQPALWRKDLAEDEKNLLWFGQGPDYEFFYSVDALTEGMSIYNQQLLEVCQQRQLECIDLATIIPQDTTAFYDDVHFNEGGARQVAEAIADYLLHHEPFEVESSKN